MSTIRPLYYSKAWHNTRDFAPYQSDGRVWSADANAEEVAGIWDFDKHLLGGFITEDPHEEFLTHKHEEMPGFGIFLPTSWFTGKVDDLRCLPGGVVYDFSLGREVFFWNTTKMVGTIIGHTVQLENGLLVEVTEPGTLEVFDNDNPATSEDVPRPPGVHLKLVKVEGA